MFHYLFKSSLLHTLVGEPLGENLKISPVAPVNSKSKKLKSNIILYIARRKGKISFKPNVKIPDESTF